MSQLQPTRVQFPRFQQEEPSGQPFPERTLIWKAESEQWLSKLLLNTVLNPLAIEQKDYKDLQHQMRRQKWWGVYHTATELVTPETPASVVDGKPGDGFRLRLLHHDYLWDHQGYSGTAKEAILELHHHETDRHVELAALLVKEWKNEQRFVINSDGAGWHAPVPEEHDTAQGYLFGMLLAANRPASKV